MANSSSWVTQRTEEYSYDPDFDYLTGVDYNDGNTNEVQTWSYDAAGNRASASANPGTWSYDNLNRMSSSPGATYLHDAVGNRTQKISGGQTTVYGWDAANRMVECGPGFGDRQHYTYRADGMRVKKDLSGTVERFFYDGQMPVESDKQGTVTRNFVGARGIDVILTTSGASTSTAYPLYDCHGNMVATLTKNTAGTAWSTGNLREYDAWGTVRNGQQTGSPANRHCANLCHVADDESGLTYMRARYYEPTTGRFISEDPARDGNNWYAFCSNDPASRVDRDGRDDDYFGFALGLGLLCLLLSHMTLTGFMTPCTPKDIVLGAVELAFAAFWLGEAAGETQFSDDRLKRFLGIAQSFLALFTAYALVSAQSGSKEVGCAKAAIILSEAYALTCIGLIIHGYLAD